MNSDFKIQRPDQVINVRQFGHEKKKELLTSVKIFPGQTFWELDLTTQKISPVTYEVKTIEFDGELTSDVNMKENHLYCVALNENNAMRKFIKMCKSISSKKI